MTRVIVNPGHCGFTTTIDVGKVAKRRVKVVITSDCEMVTELAESFTTDVDAGQALKQGQALSEYVHATCPVPIAVLKAIEVEAGLGVPCDVVILFDSRQR